MRPVHAPLPRRLELCKTGLSFGQCLMRSKSRLKEGNCACSGWMQDALSDLVVMACAKSIGPTQGVSAEPPISGCSTSAGQPRCM